MDSPLRWGGLKVHTPAGEPPAHERADARRRQAFTTLSAPPPAAPVKPALPAQAAKPPRPPAPPPRERPAPAEPRQARADSPARAPEAEDTALPPVVDDAAVGGGEPDFQGADMAWPLPATLEVSAPDDGGLGAAVVAYLSHTVTTFCNNPAVCDADGWRVSMRLNESLLAATTLHMKLTLNWLILRFECADALARNLISAHRMSLTEALEAAITPRREVSIDVG